MDSQILTNVVFELYGLSGILRNSTSTETAFQLMNKMWQVVKSNGLKNKGLNVWVYEPGNMVFAGVELLEKPSSHLGLERKNIVLKTCAFCKHTGPYRQIPQTGEFMRAQLKKQGLEPGFPYVEVYGHWTKDEAALETDLYLALK